MRAIFIGAGGAGKTSLIRALHDEPIPASNEMTRGIAVHDASPRGRSSQASPAPTPSGSIDNDPEVYVRVTDIDEHDLTVHFWDFGGQVMAHATHQFFMRARCLYVIVLAARSEINANEEAEYWLEHVRAFGDSAPVLLVGNKADQLPVNLDLRTLKQKHPNIVDFYSLCCADTKGRFRPDFERFSRDFYEQLLTLGSHAERFTDAQFRTLKKVEAEAAKADFLSRDDYRRMCEELGIPADGPQSRATLLDLFDKLGIVMHFPALPFLEDLVLNPRWLTYGVYTIMYDEKVLGSRGLISQTDVVAALRNPAQANRYPAERCAVIVDAMEAFGVAYRLAHARDRLVIPALLPPGQPAHDFPAREALAFRFEFKGFLPRHVLPALIVERHVDIARDKEGREIVWQNGVLLRPGRGIDAEALVRADHHDRIIDVLVAGSDARQYLTLIRDSIRRQLATMPQLRVEELVELRPEMRADGAPERDLLRGGPVLASYNAILGAERLRQVIVGPDGHAYDLDKVLAVTPLRTDLAKADVFISYSHRNRSIAEGLANTLGKEGITVWFDPALVGGQAFRDVIAARLDAAKAVLVVWSEDSVDSDWVRAEAGRAKGGGKLVSLLADGLPRRSLPIPFGEGQVVKADDLDGIRAGLARLGVSVRR